MGSRGPAPLYKSPKSRLQADGALIVPDGLDEPGKTLWFRVAEYIQSRNIGGEIDSAAVEMYCRVYNLLRRSEAEARNDPLDKFARCAVTGYLSSFIALGAKLGLTPADRARIQSGETDDDDSADKDLLGD